MKKNDILALGAYGLAGRTVMFGLMSLTNYSVVAAGRDMKKLKAVLSGLPADRCRLLELDAGDPLELKKACESSKLVINTIGPYAILGSQIARIALEEGASYIDCANEQVHYKQLQSLDAFARDQGLLIATAAGAIPGFSTLLTVKLLDQLPSATSVDIAFAQFRHAYQDSGLASIMSGILDAVHQPYALVSGSETPVLLGKSFKEIHLPSPFGKKKMLEVPTIDTITLPKKYPLENIHSWFYLGEQPAWLFGLIRMLKPHKRQWAYDLIKKVAHFTDSQEFEKAIQAGHGPEALLNVEIRDGNDTRFGSVLLRDGAIPMAYLPALIAGDILAGNIEKVGLVTPLDLMSFDRLVEVAGDAIISIDLPQN